MQETIKPVLLDLPQTPLSKGGVTGDVLFKKVFLNISQNSQENICARVSFLIKKDANFAKF